MRPTVAAIVPMRHHSQRVPGKNYREFAGRPLFHRIVDTLLQCPHIAQVVIDTDSHVICSDAAQHFPQVRLLNRPAHLCDGATSMNDVLLHTTSQIAADFYVQTHSTNPLLRPQTIERCIDAFFASQPGYDSLFSVTRVQARLWDGLARAVNHNPNILLRTQDLPPMFQENSCLYMFSRAALQANRNRIGPRPMMLEIDPAEAVDIDNESDFRIAEVLYLDSQRSLREAVA